MYTESMDDKQSGFREIEHTADWALEIWAPSLESLFRMAVRGINSLTGVELNDEEDNVQREIRLSGFDYESLLVDFLTEVLYLGEESNLGVSDIEIEVTRTNLRANLYISKIVSQEKEIKAVTYHNLNIDYGENGYSTILVFDV